MRTCMHCGRAMGRLKRCACGRSYVAPVAAATSKWDTFRAKYHEEPAPSFVEQPWAPYAKEHHDARCSMLIVGARARHYCRELRDWLEYMHRVVVTLSEIAPRDVDPCDPFGPGAPDWGAANMWNKAEAVRDLLEAWTPVPIQLCSGEPDGVVFIHRERKIRRSRWALCRYLSAETAQSIAAHLGIDMEAP